MKTNEHIIYRGHKITLSVPVAEMLNDDRVYLRISAISDDEHSTHKCSVNLFSDNTEAEIYEAVAASKEYIDTVVDKHGEELLKRRKALKAVCETFDRVAVKFGKESQ